MDTIYFFFGKKKKRKPVCTCHLVYGGAQQQQQYNNGVIESAGQPGAQTSDPNAHHSNGYLTLTQFGANEANSSMDLVYHGGSSNQSSPVVATKQHHYASAQVLSPYMEYQGENRMAANQLCYSHPHHNSQHYHHHPQQQQQQHHLQQQQQQPNQFVSHSHLPRHQYPSETRTQPQPIGSLTQSYPNLDPSMESEVPQQMSNLSIHQWHRPNCDSYEEKYLQINQNYAPNAFPKLAQGSANSYQQLVSTYSPDLNLQRRLAAGAQAYPGSSPAPLSVTLHQRRWSDSNTRYAKSDSECLRNECSYLPPKVFPCQCRHCATEKLNYGHCDRTTGDDRLYLDNMSNPSTANMKPSRPKVSFGPLMMYPTDSELYGNDLKGTNASSKKTSKLTTELLPLDTQIPLQMMSDSALVCRII